MQENRTTPAAGPAATGAQRTASALFGAFDTNRFGVEVANEIGVDPNNLGAYGLTPEQIRAYESQLHSGTQQGGSR